MMQDTESLIQRGAEDITKKNVLKAVAKKSGFLMAASILDTSTEMFRIYMFSKLDLESLAASTLIYSTISFVLIPMIGLTSQNAVFVSKEFGKTKLLLDNSHEISSLNNTLENGTLSKEQIYQNIGNIIRQGWCLSLLASIPCMAVFFSIKPILDGLKITEDVSSKVGEFFFPYAFSVPFLIASNVNTRFFSAIDQEKWLPPYRLLMLIVNVCLNLLLIPKYGTKGGGITMLIQAILGFLATTLFIGFKSNFKPFKLFDFKYRSGTYIKDMIKQGIPITIAMLFAEGTTFTISIFIGQLGKLRLAIEQSLVQCYAIPLILASVISEATNRLVAQVVGEHNYKIMRRYGNIGLLSSSLLFVLFFIIYNIIPLPLASIFIDRDKVADSKDLIRLSFLLTGLVNLFITIQESSVLNLAGMEDTFFSATIRLLSIALIILPFSAISTYATDFDIYGILGSLNVGLFLASSIITGYWFFLSNKSVANNDFDTSNSKISTTMQRCSFFKKREQIISETDRDQLTPSEEGVIQLNN